MVCPDLLNDNVQFGLTETSELRFQNDECWKAGSDTGGWGAVGGSEATTVPLSTLTGNNEDGASCSCCTFIEKHICYHHSCFRELTLAEALHPSVGTMDM